MLNEIQVQGRLTKDPVLRYTQSGKAVCGFTVACERDFKSGDGERATDYIECVAWTATGEFISEHFHKGDMIVVSGRLQMRDWTDRDGNKRTTAEIVVARGYFCGSKRTADVTAVDVDAGDFRNGFDDMEDDDGELPF